MKTLILIVFFLFLGAFFIISEGNIKLNSSENMNNFISDYSSWFSGISESLKTFTGYFVKMEWLPEG